MEQHTNILDREDGGRPDGYESVVQVIGDQDTFFSHFLALHKIIKIFYFLWRCLTLSYLHIKLFGIIITIHHFNDIQNCILEPNHYQDND